MSANNKEQDTSKQLPCSLVIERALTVAGIERRAILSCGTDQHHVYCPAYYQNFIDDAENKLAECERKLGEIEEREAACCPEDVGFDEYIKALERALAECEREKERISLQYGANLPATCDWGDCDEKATGFRYDEAGHGWLPICDGHNPLVADLERKLAAAREALQRIATDPHINYGYRSTEHKAGGRYDIGLTDGHRCAAAIAQQALTALTEAGEGEK